jgi:uridine phosphorylase
LGTIVEKSLYLKLDPSQVGEAVLLTGDPARVDRIADALDDAAVTGKNREFYSVAGSYKGRRITGASSGIGAPSAAIAVEELAHLGVKAVIRVGTMMSVQAPMGAFVLSTGAVRSEGTSSAYLPMPYPAVPDWSLTQQLASAAGSSDHPLKLGITATLDAFYPDMAPTLIGREDFDLSEYRESGVLALDMETALLFILSLRLKIAAASMCLITNQAQPFSIIDAAARAVGEVAMIQTALEGVWRWLEAADA